MYYEILDYSTLDEILADVETVSRDNFIQAQHAEVIERYLKKRIPNLIVGKLSTHYMTIPIQVMNQQPKRNNQFM